MDPKQRERILMLGAIALAVVVLLGWGVSSVVGAVRSMETDVEQAEADLRKMRLMVRDLNQLSAKTGDLRQVLAQRRFALLSHLDTIASKAGVSRPDMKPRNVTPTDYYAEESVEAKVKKLTLRQLITFLHEIERSRPQRMRVTYLDVKSRFDDPGLMDATLHVSAYFSPEAQLDPGAVPDVPPRPVSPPPEPEPEEPPEVVNEEPVEEAEPVEDVTEDDEEEEIIPRPLRPGNRPQLTPEEREERRARRDERRQRRKEMQEQMKEEWKDLSPEERRERMRERLRRVGPPGDKGWDR